MSANLNAVLVAKVGALYALGRHLGMWRPDRVPIALAADVRAALERRVADLSALPVQRAAVALILEHYLPGWRAAAPLDVLGGLVDRDSPEVRTWTQGVLARAGHKCQECGKTTELCAHHIVPWAVSPVLRVVPENGMALCRDCHLAAHGWSRISKTDVH